MSTTAHPAPTLPAPPGGCVAVAMSGGVDSSVAAALLRDQGHAVIGLTAILSPGFSRCCSDEDVRTARAVAAQLGIAHHVVDASGPFQRGIVDSFVAEYLAGRTPSPCVLCNRHIKFGLLLQQARQLGAERLATGHYARVARDGDRVRLRRGRDARKDQSYFLALLTDEQLRRSVFPLGDLTKDEVAGLAHAKGLAARHSRESQEVCFVDETDPGTWIDVRRLDAPGAGEIVDLNGVQLGMHRGVHHYTVGQRRGLGLAVGEPRYVVALDAARNRVVVGRRAEALGATARVRDACWIAGRPPADEFRAAVQIRYRHQAAPARVRVAPDARACVAFDEPQFAIAPGQLAAFYAGDELLGGGWIEAPDRP